MEQLLSRYDYSEPISEDEDEYEDEDEDGSSEDNDDDSLKLLPRIYAIHRKVVAPWKS